MRQIKKIKTLRWQFIRQMLLIMIVAALISGVIQFYFLLQQINENVKNQAMMIGQSIEQGIEETDLASKSLEQQIDYKLESLSQRISDKLQGKKLEDITDQDLIQLRETLHIAGITLFARKGEDIIGVKATDPHEIGFSLKNFGKDGFAAIDGLLQGKKPDGKGIVSYANDHILNLYIAQSGSNIEEPKFYKYAYYHADGLEYVINPYIEANEVYQFTQKVGPDTWIKKVIDENSFAKEIAVLDPRVFADPSLAEKLYPPLKKIIYGTYSYQDNQDQDTLVQMTNKPQTTSFIDEQVGGKVYKMFIPLDEGRVIYIALDYDKMSAPLYRHSVMLIIFGLLSLIALFMITASFFSKIYRNIQQIIHQIKKLEDGDLTAKSHITGGGELADLSESSNKMADALHQLLTDTHEKATKAQTVSILLENEANQSVDKAFTMSMETTSKAREAGEEIYYFMDQIMEYLQQQRENPKAQAILNKMNEMRDLAEQRTNNTTEITIALADLFKSLHEQSSELSDLSNSILQQLEKFNL